MREMHISLVLMLLFSTGFKGLQVQGPAGPVVTQLGATVILPCITHTPLPLEGLEIEWRKTDSDSLVSIFQQGESRPELQSEAFRRRVHFFPNEIAKGNFSILMKTVGKNDIGIYRCKISTIQDSREILVEMKDLENLVTVADHAILASVGDEVILNCSVDPNVPVQEIEEVTWKQRDQDLLVLLYQDNTVFSDASHERYQGRAEFFVQEISKGNFSIKLKGVKIEDKGEYMCEVHTSHASAHAIVVLQSLGVSRLHILIWFLCLAALLLAVGLGVPVFIMLIKQVIDGKIMKINTFLIFCPNICMSAAFMLWYTEGFLTEVVICSTVSIIRPVVLMKISPDLKLPKHLSKAVKTLAIPVYHSAIAIAVCSMLFYIRPPQRAVDHIFTAVAALMILLCFCSIISAYYARQVRSALCLEACLGIQLGFVLFQGQADVDTNIQVSTVLEVLLFAAFVILYLQRYFFQEQDVTCRDLVIPFVLLVLGCLIALACYILLLVAENNPPKAWVVPLQISTYSVVWVALILLLCCKRSHKYGCCSQQRGKGYLCCAIIVACLLTAYGAACLHYINIQQKNFKDYSDYMALSALIQVLAATCFFKHPKDLPTLPHIMTYMFGAVGVNVVNSVTLASELRLKAETGARTIEHLTVIVLPIETIFASGWLALQIYYAWTRTKSKIEWNFKDQQEQPPQEMEALSSS